MIKIRVFPNDYQRCYDALRDSSDEEKLMTDDERDRAMNFVIENLAALTAQGQKQDVRLNKLLQAHEKAAHRLDRSERVLKLIIRTGRRERRIRREQDARYDRRYKEMRDSQAHSDSRLDALIDIVRQRMNGE